MSDNPFALDYVEPEQTSIDLQEQEREAEAVNDGPLITKPGAYPYISAEDYHRNPALLPGPSLSSSGAKTLGTMSPFHFWFDSPLNPNRPPEPDKPHFRVGKAAHDIILLNERWEQFYHVLPEGFSRAKKNQMRDAIEEADAAIEEGKTVLRYEESLTVVAIAEALKKNKLAVACLTNGVAEETLVWQDPMTGIWLRARPDFRPNSIIEKRDVMVVPDLKFVAPTHASPEGFSKAIYNFGYHQSAAWHCDGIHAVYGHRPTHWLHIVIEKPETGAAAADSPLTVSLYELPGEDIERGRVLNRRAINRFAQCLKTDHWPAYADDPLPVGLPDWARMRLDDVTPEEMTSAEAG